jgi:hypothetical protein
MYIPDLPIYLVFYFETTHGSSIDTPMTEDDKDDTLLIFSSIKFVLPQFKSIPAEFKYHRDSNSLKILFHTPSRTDARIHFKGML